MQYDEPKCIAKTHHLSYNCVPQWQKPAEIDPFDYKLRSKQEVMEEFKYNAQEFPITSAYKKYTSGDTRADDNLDNRERVVSRLVIINLIG